MSAQNPAGGPLLHGPADPEHDPRASYALEPDYTQNLTRRIVSTTGQTAPVESPLNGQPVAHVPQSSEADVREAVARARRAQEAWARTPLAERSAALLRLHDLVLDRQDEICDLIGVESGKARKDAFLELAHVALTARYYARTAHAHLDSRRVPGMFPGLTHVEVHHLPKGVVGIISPWNYPFTLALCDGLPALLAGNAVVIKPDAQTMLTALLGAELLEQAGFPPEIWQVVAGPGRDIGPPLIQGVDYMCFTGSTATGKLIAGQCADRLIGCSLELGGKNPILILRDASVEKAAEGTARASFSNAGQLCVSTERLFVADQIYDRFVERFVARTKAMTLGATLDWSVDMGTLISARPARDRHRPRRGRRRQGRPGPRRRPGPPRPRSLLLRADDPRGRHPRHDLLRPRDLRPGGGALPVPRRGGRRRPGERGRVRPQRLDLQPGRRPGARSSRGRSSAAPSTSTRASGPRSAPSPPRWAACASPEWAGGRAPRASCATPTPSRSPPSAGSGSVPPSGSRRSSTPRR